MSIIVPEAMQSIGPSVVGERRYRFVCGGGSELPIVLLPGIEGDARVFLRCAALARDREVVAMDLPRGRDSLAAMAGDVLAAVEPHQFLVVGMSLGGLVARAMAEQAPDRVVGVVGVGALPSVGCTPTGLTGQRRRLAWLAAPIFRLLYARRIRNRLTDEGVDGWEAEMLTSLLPDRDELCRRLDAILAWGLAEHPARPTLWLRGQVDREAPWGATEVASSFPGAEYETIPGGHRAPLTHSGPFCAAVARFAGQGIIATR